MSEFKLNEAVTVNGKSATYVGPNFNTNAEVMVKYRNHRIVSVPVRDIVRTIVLPVDERTPDQKLRDRVAELAEESRSMDDGSLPFKKGQLVRYPSTQTQYRVDFVYAGSMRIVQVGKSWSTILINDAARRMVVVDEAAV